MNPAAEVMPWLGGWLQRRIAAGDDGKALLVGFSQMQADFALAAGLRGEQDHPGFATFARYLLHHRFACDGHALLLPAAIAGEAVYLLHGVLAGQSLHALYDSAARSRDWRADAWPVGRLDQPAGMLPGIQRRAMDDLFETLRVSPPEQGHAPDPANGR